MMKRKISASTLHTKIIVPSVLFTGLAFLLIIDISVYEAENIIRASEGAGGCMFIIFAVILVHSILRAARIKDISIDDTFLYVSNLLGKEIKVPFSNIVRAEQTYLMRAFNVKFVLIILDVQSEFGKKIFFIPDARKHIFLEPHPIVEELNGLILCHKQKMMENNTEG